MWGSSNWVQTKLVYGLHSPRQKSPSGEPHSTRLLAWLRNDVQESMKNLTVSDSEDTRVDVHHVVTDDHARQSVHRSQDREQEDYIAALESSVVALEASKTDLEAKFRALRQQRLAVRIEQEKLKHKFISLKQNIMLKDYEFGALEKELERLRRIQSAQQQRKNFCILPWVLQKQELAMLDMESDSLHGFST